MACAAVRRVSLDRPLPSRYSIVEKDGRLIVTDMTTGERNASADLPTMADMGRGTTASAPAIVRPESVASTSQTELGPEPSTPRTKRRTDGLPPTGINQAKLAILVVAGVAGVIVLMLTWLWVPLAIAMLIPQVRALALGGMSTAIKRWVAA